MQLPNSEAVIFFQNIATEAYFRALTKLHGRNSFGIYRHIEFIGEGKEARARRGGKFILDLKKIFPTTRYPTG